ncbi:NADH:ubiquinone oxidoreductase subunit J [Aliidongia dinghuensis]|uniref:NADH-quinone oxidoreductase subunit J n=1 Tax=Aliidongia dinghuensis TaxID=1867774 RepID=A0A8J2YYC7_9PROT|nr:NADH-quinone oxidoreductase subunit J [Aliidongia dinghuensis]GGF40612.1 NADH:ubiquinone oxidoreductase subunit J [Aliidongia dinghuensis]
MILSALAFYLFAGILILSGLMVITARNPVHSVLFLILAFFNAAGLFVLVGAEFLAMILVVVYVGAVAVLFLFVVMMLDINFAALRRGIRRNLALGLTVGTVLLAELVVVVGAWAVAPEVASHTAPVVAPLVSATNTQALGSILYTRYIYAFEGSGLVLLVAMIGAIVLTHRRRSGVRRQAIATQVSRSRAETIEVVKVPTGHGI